MGFLVRKIQKSKWLQNDILGGAPVSGDAITNCLRTRNNAISAWEITSEKELEEAVLAIVSAHDHIDTIDVVIIEKDKLKTFTMSKVPGNTPVKDLVDAHIDILDINYNTLGKLAEIIVEKFRGKKVYRWTSKRIKDLLIKAINDGRLSISDLSANIRCKLKKYNLLF